MSQNVGACRPVDYENPLNNDLSPHWEEVKFDSMNRCLTEKRTCNGSALAHAGSVSDEKTRPGSIRQELLMLLAGVHCNNS